MTSTNAVVKLILQFLQENNLTKSFETLKEETNSVFNILADPEKVWSAIRKGQYDVALRSLSSLDIHPRYLVDLYEVMVLELLQHKELPIARSLLRETQAMYYMKEHDSTRYLDLEAKLSRGQLVGFALDEKDLKKRRDKAVKALEGHVRQQNDSQLLSLLGMGLKYQMEREGKSQDELVLFNDGSALSGQDDGIPSVKFRELKFPKKTPCQIATFTMDGHHLVTGIKDGMVELWNPRTGKHADIPFQNDGKFIIVSHAVTALCCSGDGSNLAVGTSSGSVHVFSLQTGKQSMKQALHSNSVSKLSFVGDGSQLLSSSLDGTIKLLGLKSGSILKEFRIEEYANTCLFLESQKQIVAGGDSLYFFNAQTGESSSFMLKSGEISIHSSSKIISLHEWREYVLVCTDEFLYYVSHARQVYKAIEIQDIVSCSVSDLFAYVLSASGVLSVVNLETGTIEVQQSVSEVETAGIAKARGKNLWCVYDRKGLVSFWK